MIKDIVMGLIETYKTTNPFEICDLLNIKIFRSNLGNEIKGFFQNTKEGYEIIHINSNLNNCETKYICAHELGHALLQTDISISFFINNPLLVKSKYEIQADKFAAELLIPNNIKIPQGITIQQLACYLEVPKELINLKFERE